MVSPWAPSAATTSTSLTSLSRQSHEPVTATEVAPGFPATLSSGSALEQASAEPTAEASSAASSTLVAAANSASLTLSPSLAQDSSSSGVFELQSPSTSSSAATREYGSSVATFEIGPPSESSSQPAGSAIFTELGSSAVRAGVMDTLPIWSARTAETHRRSPVVQFPCLAAKGQGGRGREANTAARSTSMLSPIFDKFKE